MSYEFLILSFDSRGRTLNQETRCEEYISSGQTEHFGRKLGCFA
ncbi:hypothetical protein QUB77_29930 [Microcoleus sp. AT9b-C3]